MQNKKPKVFFICCCDDRILLHKFTHKKLGDLFVLRNIGNIVPPHGSEDSSVGAALAYAIGHLGIPKIVVCGHSDCGGMKAVMAGEVDGDLQAWLAYASSDNTCSSADELSRVNVAQQIKNLLTYPVVEQAVNEGRLVLEGWWLNLETGEVVKIFPK